MKKNLIDNIQLSNELFTTSPSSLLDGEQIVTLPIDALDDFEGHPFKLTEHSIADMAESVKTHGVLEPILVRPKENDRYEIISGHRRHRGSVAAGLSTIPAIVRAMDDETATLVMVDSNLKQREIILPSERAFAYKMKLEAIKRQGSRTDLTSRQAGGKWESAEIIGKESEESGRQVQRYIRLTELLPAILDRVDEGHIAFGPAVSLSYLTKEEQEKLYAIMEADEASPSQSQANRMKELSQSGMLDDMDMLTILKEQKPNQKKLSISHEKIARYFPKDHDVLQKQEEFIIKACAFYSRYLDRKERKAER